MRDMIRRLRIPKLYFELGIIVLGALLAGLAIWFFDAWPWLVNWAWFIAGMFFGIAVLCLVVAFFAFGARGEDPTESEGVNLQSRPKPRLVKNGSSDKE